MRQGFSVPVSVLRTLTMVKMQCILLSMTPYSFIRQRIYARTMRVWRCSVVTAELGRLDRLGYLLVIMWRWGQDTYTSLRWPDHWTYGQQPALVTPLLFNELERHVEAGLNYVLRWSVYGHSCSGQAVSSQLCDGRDREQKYCKGVSCPGQFCFCIFVHLINYKNYNYILLTP